MDVNIVSCLRVFPKRKKPLSLDWFHFLLLAAFLLMVGLGLAEAFQLEKRNQRIEQLQRDYVVLWVRWQNAVLDSQ